MKEEPATDDQPLWRRVLGPAVIVAFLLFIFFWFLPKLIDYREVLDALRSLTASQFLLLLVLWLLPIAYGAPALPLFNRSKKTRPA